MAAWHGVISVRWRKVPAGPVKAPTWIRLAVALWNQVDKANPVELAAQLGPGGGAGVLGDAGEQEGEPAQDDVDADALFLAAAGGPQVDDLLEVSPAALDFQELLIAQGDILGGHRRVGGAQQVLAVEVLR